MRRSSIRTRWSWTSTLCSGSPAACSSGDRSRARLEGRSRGSRRRRACRRCSAPRPRSTTRRRSCSSPRVACCSRALGTTPRPTACTRSLAEPRICSSPPRRRRARWSSIRKGRICFGGLRGAIGVLSFTRALLNATFAALTRFATGSLGAVSDHVDAIDAQQRLPRMDMQGVATEDCRLFRGVGSGTCPRWRAAPRGGFARATPATRSSSCLLRDRSVRPVRGRRTLEFQHAARTSAQTRDVSRTRRLARSMRFDEWGRRPARRARGGSAAEHGVQDRRALRDTRA